jgi:hypothetical protein
MFNSIHFSPFRSTLRSCTRVSIKNMFFYCEMQIRANILLHIMFFIVHFIFVRVIQISNLRNMVPYNLQCGPIHIKLNLFQAFISFSVHVMSSLALLETLSFNMLIKLQYNFHLVIFQQRAQFLFDIQQYLICT